MKHRFVFVFAAACMILFGLGCDWKKSHSAEVNIQPQSGKADSLHKFKVVVNIEAYPDIVVVFKFKNKPTQHLISEINVCDSLFGEKYVVYVGSLSEDTTLSYPLYYSLFDFQATPYSKAMFNEYINNLGAIKGIENLEEIRFE